MQEVHMHRRRRFWGANQDESMEIECEHINEIDFVDPTGCFSTPISCQRCEWILEIALAVGGGYIFHLCLFVCLFVRSRYEVKNGFCWIFGEGRGPENNRLDFGGYPDHRGGSSPKILGHCHHQLLHHRLHFLRSPKPKKYELHIGLYLKSFIVNSVTG